MYFNHHISKTITKREPTLEPFILEYPKHSYFYAKQILKSPWKEGEKTLLGGEDTGTIKAEYVYLYAKNILKGRWKEGERALLKTAKDDTEDGYYWADEAKSHLAIYAKNVIKGRWKEAESLIAQSKNIGLYLSILENEDLEEFRNMITLEAIGGSPSSKKFFSWNPTHKVKMKGSKAFDIMLDPDYVRNSFCMHDGIHVNKQSAYKLSEWLNGDHRTDIAFLPSTNEWLWKSRRHYQKKILEGTVTPLG